MKTLSASSWDSISVRWQNPPLSTQGKICPLNLLSAGVNGLHKTLIVIAAIILAIATPILLCIDRISPPKAIPMGKMSQYSILNFYKDQKNDKGVTLQEIWGWNDQTLENRHDFIQWLFPLKTKSQFNLTAATTDTDTIKAFQKNQNLSEKMLRSLDVMLTFYGFQRNGDQITVDSTFAQKSKNWLNQGNHNYLRISRILHSLRLHGLKGEATAFYRALEQVYKLHSDQIGQKTFRFWTGAARPPPLR